MQNSIKSLLLFFAFGLMLSNQVAFAQNDTQCIEILDKPSACNHFIIKVADPRIIRTSNIQRSPVCICLSDFPSVFANNQSEIQLTNKEQLILDNWQLSLNDLNQLLRY